MKKLLKVILIIFMICLFTVASTTNAFAEVTNNTNITNVIDNEVSKLIADKSTKGAIVSIVKDDKVQLCKGYGYANEKRVSMRMEILQLLE